MRTTTWIELERNAPLPICGDEEFVLQGSSERIDDPGLRASVVTASAGQQGAHAFERLFRCRIATALHTWWDGWGMAAAWPKFTKWRARSVRSMPSSRRSQANATPVHQGLWR